MQVTETVTRPQARVQGRRSRRRSRQQGRCASSAELKDQVRINGFRPGKVPVASQAPLRPLGDGRDDRARCARPTPRSSPSAASSSPRAAGDAAGREGRRRAGYRGQDRSRLHDGDRDPAAIELADFKGIQLERLNAEVTDAEVDEARGNASPSRAGRSRPRAKAPRPRRRPRHHRFHRQDRGRAVRGRHRRRRHAASWLGQLHSGLRGATHRRCRGRTRTINVTFPQTIRPASPVRKRVRRHCEGDRGAADGQIDDGFAKSLGLESLPSSARW